MTEDALTKGLAWLFVLWPHRADSSQTVAAMRLLYREALGDLTDAAFLAGCAAAVRTCRHFPVPAELRDLAEQEADAAYRDGIQAHEQRHLLAAAQHGQRLLTAGVVDEAQAERNRQRLARMAGDTLRAIRAGGERARVEGRRQWLHERQAARHRRIAEGHWNDDAGRDATPTGAEEERRWHSLTW